jgi:hypothetical protein
VSVESPYENQREQRLTHQVTHHLHAAATGSFPEVMLKTHPYFVAIDIFFSSLQLFPLEYQQRGYIIDFIDLFI